MTAISKTYTAIADASIDPDAPLLSSLMYALRDNITHTREWLGAGYVAGAVQDHNHDGVNSALIQVGANLLRNGSFESDTASWGTTPYTGGTVAVNTANAMDVGKCLAFTSTVLANGGGYADSAEFIPVAAGLVYAVKALAKGSAANISSKIEVNWYNSAQALLSTSTAYTSTTTSTTQAEVGSDVTAPASARYMKVRLTGGIPASGSATGTVYFDGVTVGMNHAYTQAVGDNSNKIASTAFCEAGFVNNDIGVGGVGSMMRMRLTTGTVASGATVAGSSLNFTFGSSTGDTLTGVTASGTWRNISSDTATTSKYSVFQRIA
jgi:hypothetical protein